MYNIKKGKQEKIVFDFVHFFFYQMEFLSGFSRTKKKFLINSFLGRNTGNVKNHS